MAVNNFKLLEEEMEARFEKSAESIKKNVNDQRNLWSLIGDLFDLYIPKIFNTIIGSNVSLGSGFLKNKSEK